MCGWNSLPDSLCVTSLSIFKRSIRMVYDFSNFYRVIVINFRGNC